MAAVTETHIFTPNLLNVVRVGYNRNVAAVNTPLSSLNAAASDTTVGYFPGNEAPLLNIAGYVQARRICQCAPDRDALQLDSGLR